MTTEESKVTQVKSLPLKSTKQSLIRYSISSIGNSEIGSPRNRRNDGFDMSPQSLNKNNLLNGLGTITNNNNYSISGSNTPRNIATKNDQQYVMERRQSSTFKYSMLNQELTKLDEQKGAARSLVSDGQLDDSKDREFNEQSTYYDPKNHPRKPSNFSSFLIKEKKNDTLLVSHIQEHQDDKLTDNFNSQTEFKDSNVYDRFLKTPENISRLNQNIRILAMMKRETQSRSNFIERSHFISIDKIKDLSQEAQQEMFDNQKFFRVKEKFDQLMPLAAMNIMKNNTHSNRSQFRISNIQSNMNQSRFQTEMSTSTQFDRKSLKTEGNNKFRINKISRSVDLSVYSATSKNHSTVTNTENKTILQIEQKQAIQQNQVVQAKKSVTDLVTNQIQTFYSPQVSSESKHRQIVSLYGLQKESQIKKYSNFMVYQQKQVQQSNSLSAIFPNQQSVA